MLGLGLGLNKMVGRVRPKNLLVYNPITWAEWTKTAGVTGDASGLEFTLNNTVAQTATLNNTAFKNSTKYGILYNIVSNSLAISIVELKNKDLSDTYPRIANSGSGTGNKNVVFTTKANITNNRFVLGDGSLVDNGLKVKIKDIRAFELPAGSEIEADFTNLTADQLNAKYPF